MKTKVSLKYFVNDCGFNIIGLLDQNELTK